VGNIRGSGRVRAGGGRRRRRGRRGLERLVMHETHYFYLGQAESGAELQSIFCLSLLQPHSSLTLCLAEPPFYPRSTQFRSFWFRSELIRACAVPGRVSFVRSFVRSLIRSGWLAGVTPCNRNLHPGSYYLHFNSARLSLPPSLPPPPPLPNGGYKHKYEFKGPRATMYP